MTAAKGGMARIQRALEAAGLHQFKFHARLGYFGIKLQTTSYKADQNGPNIIPSEFVIPRLDPPPRMIDPSTLSLPIALAVASTGTRREGEEQQGRTNTVIYPSRIQIKDTISSIQKAYIDNNGVDLVMDGKDLHFLWQFGTLGQSEFETRLDRRLRLVEEIERAIDLDAARWQCRQLMTGEGANLTENGSNLDGILYAFSAYVWEVGRIRILVYGPAPYLFENSDCHVHFSVQKVFNGKGRNSRNRLIFNMMSSGSLMECQMKLRDQKSPGVKGKINDHHQLLHEVSLRSIENVAERFHSDTLKANIDIGCEWDGFLEKLEILYARRKEKERLPSEDGNTGGQNHSSTFHSFLPSIPDSEQQFEDLLRSLGNLTILPTSSSISEEAWIEKIQKACEIAGLSEFKVLKDLSFFGWRATPRSPGDSNNEYYKFITKLTSDALWQNYDPDTIPNQLEGGYLEDKQLPIEFDRGDQNTERSFSCPPPLLDILLQKKSQGNNRTQFSLYGLAFQLLSRDVLDFPTPGNLVLSTPRRQLFAMKPAWSGSLIIFSISNAEVSSLKDSGYQFERLMTRTENDENSRIFHGSEFKIGPFRTRMACEVDAVSSSNEIVELKLNRSRGRSSRNSAFFQMLRNGSTLLIKGKTGWLDGQDQIFLKSIKKYELTDLAQRFNHENDVEEMQSRLIRNLERLHALKISGAIETGMLYELYQTPSEEGGEAVLDINPITLGAAHLFPPNHVVQDFLDR